MKTFEDFESMTVPQIQGILTSLGVSFKKNAPKADLVRLAVDTQQPDPDEKTEETPEPDKAKPTDVQGELDVKLKEIAEFHEGDIEEKDEEIDGAKVYSVIDVAGDEITRGTFETLYEPIRQINVGAGEPLQGIEDVPLGEDTAGEPVDVSSPDIQDADNLAAIETGLKALGVLGLRYTIDGSVVKLTRGSKVVSMNLNQPSHRVIREAESICNYSR